MTEYIEREKAQDGLDSIDWYHINDKGRLVEGGKSDMETYVPFKAVEEMLNSIPAADVVEVRHGRWERVDYGNGLYNYHCSSCRHIPRENIMSNYCPNCGAKMTEDRHEQKE